MTLTVISQSPAIVPISATLIDKQRGDESESYDFIELSSHVVTMKVTSRTSAELLTKVLEVLSHAE